MTNQILSTYIRAVQIMMYDSYVISTVIVIYYQPKEREIEKMEKDTKIIILMTCLQKHTHNLQKFIDK